MPTTIDIKGPHNWVKLNNVTLEDGRGYYDKYECKKCGIKGKRRNVARIKVDGRHSDEKIKNCDGNFPKYIEITNKGVQNAGSQFKNLKPGTKHNVVTPPEGYTNSPSGVWVQGVGEPVKVLAHEFKPAKKEGE